MARSHTGEGEEANHLPGMWENGRTETENFLPHVKHLPHQLGIRGGIFDTSHPFLPNNSCPPSDHLPRRSWFCFDMTDFVSQCDMKSVWYNMMEWGKCFLGSPKKDVVWNLSLGYCAKNVVSPTLFPFTHLQLCLTLPQHLYNAVRIRFVAQSIDFTKFKSLEKTSIFLIMKYKPTIKNRRKKGKNCSWKTGFVFVFSEQK